MRKWLGLLLIVLGRALMSAPTFLLIDEPSVGLAPILVSRVIAKIRELKERRGLTILIAEQYSARRSRSPIAPRSWSTAGSSSKATPPSSPTTRR
jgi:hypothetical protein